MLLLLNLLTLAGNCVSPVDTLPAPSDSAKTGFRTERKLAVSYMVHQVSHISEFVRRFNGEQPNFARTPEDSLLLTTESREQKIVRLFDKNALASQPSGSLLQKRKALFLETVSRADQSSRLSFPSATMFARVNIDVLYAGGTHSVKFLLKSAEKDSAYSWKILGVTVLFPMAVKPKTQAKPLADSTPVFIPLNAQETSFLTLFNHIRDRHNLLTLAAAPVAPDSPLAQLNQLVQQGKISPVRTEQPVVWIQWGDAWLMQLEYHNREQLNSGWLITNLFWLPGGDAAQLPKEFGHYLVTHKP